MNKRLTIILLALLGVVLLLAQTTKSEIKLVATKIEMNGQVKLLWTKAHNADNTTQYNLYRATYSDTVGTIMYTGSDTLFVDQVPPTMSPLPQIFAYRVVAKTGVNVEVSNVFLVQLPGLPPYGTFRLEGKIDSGKVKLLWQVPPVNTPVSYYLVYRALANGIIAPSLENAELIDSTQNQYSITKVPDVSLGGHLIYTFVVRAKLSTGVFLTSTFLNLTIENKIPRDNIKFVSIPNQNAQMNVPYIYTAKAVSSDPTAVIRYFGWGQNQMGWPVTENFKIDSITGVVTWTPQLKGLIKIAITAKSNKGGVAKQEFVVSASGGNGIIQGKITDTLNVGIPNAIIEVYKTETSTNLSFAYSVRTDPNGNYRIHRVDPGNYKLRANAPSTKYQSQWYDGKREVSLADIVTVIDSPAVSIANFKLRGGVMNAAKVKINGTVTDTTGFAINGAETRVVFVRAEFALNFGSGMNAGLENFRKYFEYNMHGDFRLEGNSEYVIKAKVDSLGNYSVLLPPGGYIAFARAKGYAVEFYNEQSNILSADIFRAHNDTVGIDFTLSPLPPVVLGEIKGSVLDSVKDIVVPSRVLAFRDGWRYNDMHRIGRSYITDTDSLGMYKFGELLPGTYIVMALPLGNYAPAFYSTDTMNVRWKRATRIEVNGNSVDNIDIYVKQFGPSGNGFTAITGTVSIMGGNGMMNGSNRAGAVVYAYRNGEAVGYSFTNAEGNYAITGLSPGQYSVFVDKAGYNESNVASVNASYDINGSPLSGTANFTINGVLSVTENKNSVRPTQYMLNQNYPNPFNPSTTIKYSLPNNGNITLKVYNLIGQEVATLINSYQTSGEYAVTFNASNLSSGVYFYRLESGSFNVVKKMLLMK